MSADNFVGVWFDGTRWRVRSGLSAETSFKKRKTLELAFDGALKFATREEALVHAHDLANAGNYEYGVIELRAEEQYIYVRGCPHCNAWVLEAVCVGEEDRHREGGDNCPNPNCLGELEPTAKRVDLGTCIPPVALESLWEDRDDAWSEAIAAAHPAHNDRAHEQWAIAMKMVGNRHSKGALVALVSWLLWSRIPDPSL